MIIRHLIGYAAVAAIVAAGLVALWLLVLRPRLEQRRRRLVRRSRERPADPSAATPVTEPV